MSEVIAVNDLNFEEEVVNSDIPVLVDFMADWCAPCKALSPIIDEINQESDGRVKVVKVNIDQSPNTAARMNVRSLPTIMIFKDGEVRNSHIGSASKKQVLNMFL